MGIFYYKILTSMSEDGDKVKISRRDFLKIAGLGAAGAGAALVASKLGLGTETPSQQKPQERAERISKKEFVSPQELLGEGYKVTSLDPEGIDPEKEPPIVYDVKSQGSGFEGVDENLEQGGFFYLSGQRREEFPYGASVSMKVSLYESKDGKKKYIVFGVDNASFTDAGKRFDPASVEYQVTFPMSPMRPVSEAGKPVSQKEAEEGGGTITIFNPKKPQVEGDKVKEWESQGAMFFVELEDPERPWAENVIPGGTFVPTKLRIRMKDSGNNTSINFTATKRPEK